MPDAVNYSDATVELVAAAIASARDDDVFTEVEWNGSHWDGLRDSYRADARAALDALAAAGVLLPEGAGAPVKRFAIRATTLAGDTEVSLCVSRAEAEERVKPYRRRSALYAVGPHVVWRDAQLLADGSVLLGTWSPIPPEPKESTDG